MPRWIEIALTTDGEAAEAIAQELYPFCHQGLSIEQLGIMPGAWDDGDVPPPTAVVVRGYFLEDERAESTRAEIERILGYLNMMYPMPTPEYRLVDDEDWAEAWKANYHPVRLGRRIFIRPLWVEAEAEPQDIVISLDPGMAFGTGTHPTTQLCLEALEDHVKPGQQVLDLGCGSGILAIAAAKLGAAHVLGVDIDDVARRVTDENAAVNGVAQQITARTGTLEDVLATGQTFDLIVVNILARVIISMCQQGLGQTLRPGGQAILSGLILEQADEVEAALRQAGFIPTARRLQGDWVAIEAHKVA
ncbi:MAG: 50S ribosomal protein L11 methyltransferase [Anaerolineae bacterium]|nr:50S ribosomal protein L11 methyltransferase [Anaerolineae bacterium]MDW8172879.1 50S ribosomal protein L11 methyltransferase [Anaerolineae bacterium]